MTVVAVFGEVEGTCSGTPSVALIPHLPPLFNCGASTCMKEIVVKLEVHAKWRAGLVATYVKLRPNKCDFCFQLPQKVHRSCLTWYCFYTSFHRCKRCLTKTYCSEDCRLNDLKEKHRELCTVGQEEWKVKRGAEGRVKSGLKDFEAGVQRVMMADMKPEVLRTVVEVRAMCEKMESAKMELAK